MKIPGANQIEASLTARLSVLRPLLEISQYVTLAHHIITRCTELNMARPRDTSAGIMCVAVHMHWSLVN